MTYANDRAVLEKVLDTLGVYLSNSLMAWAPEDFHNHAGLLCSLRSTLQVNYLSVPDAAQVKAQARRECAWIADERAYVAERNRMECREDGDLDGAEYWNGMAKGQRDVADRIRALADQPAARGEKEDEKPTDVGTPVVAYATASTEAASVGSLRPGLLRAAEMARVRASLFLGASGQFGQGHHAACTTLADALTAEAAKHAETPETKMDDAAVLELLFSRAPGPDSDFIEAEVAGRGVRCGEWVERDGYWRLRITRESLETALRSALSLPDAAHGEKHDKPEAATHEVPGGVAGRDRAGDTPPPASLDDAAVLARWIPDAHAAVDRYAPMTRRMELHRELDSIAVALRRERGRLDAVYVALAQLRARAKEASR